MHIVNLRQHEARETLIYLKAPGYRRPKLAALEHESREEQMIRLIAVAVFALLVTVSAQAMTAAPIVSQPDDMVIKVAAACGMGRTRVNGVCVARTTMRQTRRAVRRCAVGMTC